MNILVTGANGQLGNEMRRVAAKSPNNYVFTDVAELDITNAAAVLDMVKAIMLTSLLTALLTPMSIRLKTMWSLPTS